VDPLWRDTEHRKDRFHVCHEAGRPAEVNVRLSWNAGLVEHRSRNATGTVEILTQPIE